MAAASAGHQMQQQQQQHQQTNGGGQQKLNNSAAAAATMNNALQQQQQQQQPMPMHNAQQQQQMMQQYAFKQQQHSSNGYHMQQHHNYTMQQQHQQTNGGGQQKLNNSAAAAATMNNALQQQQQQQQQPMPMHNAQQQQHMMQQYAFKQQQHSSNGYHMQQHHNYTMQQQQTYNNSHQQQQQQQQLQHLKMQQQQQQQQQHHPQLYQHRNDSSPYASNMMPCQSFMTPPPQLHSQASKYANGQLNSHGHNSIGNTSSMSTTSTSTTTNYNGTHLTQWSQQQFGNFQQTTQRKQHFAAVISSNGHNNNEKLCNGQMRSKASAGFSTCNTTSSASSNQISPGTAMMQQSNSHSLNSSAFAPACGPHQQLGQAEMPQSLVDSVLPDALLEELTSQDSLPLVGGEDEELQHDAKDLNCDVSKSLAMVNGLDDIDDQQGDLEQALQLQDIDEMDAGNGVEDEMNDMEQEELDDDEDEEEMEYNKANLPPGWRRVANNNNEIVYISPTGVNLRSPFQIKDYLLSADTCKCGLPCPLRPECFFDFNIQVPNAPLHQNNGFMHQPALPTTSSGSNVSAIVTQTVNASAASTSSSTSSASSSSSSASSASASSNLPASSSSQALPNGLAAAAAASAESACQDTMTATIPAATPSSSLTCLHQRRFLDCQQLHAQPTELFNKGCKPSILTHAESMRMIDSHATAAAAAASSTSSATFGGEASLTLTTSFADVGREQRTTSQPAKMLPPCSGGQQQAPTTTVAATTNADAYNNNGNAIANKNSQPAMQGATSTCAKEGSVTTVQQEHVMHQQHLADDTAGTANVHWSTLKSRATPTAQQVERNDFGTDFNGPSHQTQSQPQPQMQSQFHSHHQQQQQMSLFKEDLDCYLQHQTDLLHNSLLDVQQQQRQVRADDNNVEEAMSHVDCPGLAISDDGEQQQAADDDNNEEEDDDDDAMDDLEDDDFKSTDQFLKFHARPNCAAANQEVQADATLAQVTDTQHTKEEQCHNDGKVNEPIEEDEDDEDDQEEHEMEDEEDEQDDEEDDDDDDEEEEEEEDEEDMEADENMEDNEDEEEHQEKPQGSSALSSKALEQTVIEPHLVEVPKLCSTQRLLTNQNATFYQVPICHAPEIKQHNNFSNLPKLTAIQNPSYRQLHRAPTLQSQSRQLVKLVPTAQESPVSSSTIGGSRGTPDSQRRTPDTHGSNKKPEQVGAISTSNGSPRPYTPSPAAVSHEASASKALGHAKLVASPMPSPMLQAKSQHTAKNPNQQVRVVRQMKNVNHHQQHQVSQSQRVLGHSTSGNSTHKTLNTHTTMAGSRGAAATTTTTMTSVPGQRIVATNSLPTVVTQKLQAPLQKPPAAASTTTTSIPISQLQLQPLLRTATDNSTGNSQIIMTSTGQIIVVPSSASSKPHPHLQPLSQQQQVIIATSNVTPTTQTAPTTNLIIQQSDMLSNGGQLTATLQQQPNGSYTFSQPAATAATAAATAPQLQPATVILNSTGQNLLSNSGAKVLTNAGNLIHATGTQPLLTAGNQLITAPAGGNAANVLGQQTVVLNSLPGGGYVIQQQQPASAAPAQQQQFSTLEGPVVSQIVQQPDGTQRIIITSTGDLKRRPKKRKNSPTPAPTLSAQISSSLPSQAATLLQQHAATIQAAAQQQQATAAAQPQVVQLTAAAPAGSATTAAAGSFPTQFQLSSTGIQGIVVSKPATATTSSSQPQQILLQNGQIIQPMNLLGQQLILPTTGLVMASDSTLLQIQNVGSCGPTANILTATAPQATMMLRAASPQTNKSFISSATTGQQFLVGSNGQLSPIGQIYSTPMGLVMPTTSQHNPTPTATFVQQNGTLQMQQPTAQTLSATPAQHVTLQALQQHHHQQQQNLNHVVTNPMGIVLETATSSTTPPSLQASSNSRSSAASPPDTTTHSPRSPERPPSHRSGGSDMVQCVSSSEPDGGTISPLSNDSRQSPSTTVCDKGIVMSSGYQNTNIYKPSEAKIRRVQTPPQYQLIGSAGAAAAMASNVAKVSAHIGGITNLTLHQHAAATNMLQAQQQQQHQPQHHGRHMDNMTKSTDSHDSPQSSPTTTVHLTPPPPRTPTPLQQVQQLQQQQQQLQQHQIQSQQQQHFVQNTPSDGPKTPTKQNSQRNRSRSLKSSSHSQGEELRTPSSSGTPPPPPLAASLQRTFVVGELIWGPARGFPAWPGKVVKIPDNLQESVWVQWFGGGGRSNTEIMALHLLQSLSEGLEAHHKAQKDTRKSRKLNSQLEKAIQEAMTELDRISATSSTHKQQPTSTSTQHQTSPNRANKRPIPRTGGFDLIAGLTNNYTSSNAISTTTGSRPKPIRIAPAPPGGSPSKSSTTSLSSAAAIAAGTAAAAAAGNWSASTTK